MKRLFWTLAGLATLGLYWRRRCVGGKPHQPKRQPVGGYRCPTCLQPFTDLEDAYLMDGPAFVSPLRRGVVPNGTERAAR